MYQPQRVIKDAMNRRKTGLMGSVGPLEHCKAVVTDHRECHRQATQDIGEEPHDILKVKFGGIRYNRNFGHHKGTNSLQQCRQGSGSSGQTSVCI